MDRSHLNISLSPIKAPTLALPRRRGFFTHVGGRARGSFGAVLSFLLRFFCAGPHIHTTKEVKQSPIFI